MPIPDYSGSSIVNLMSSVVAALGGGDTGYPTLPSLSPAEIAEFRQVVLIVVDGLGCEFLSRRRGRSALEELCRARLTSVFPSTTAAAVTTFLTGLAPQQHGLTGWHMYFRELATVLAVMPGLPRTGGATLRQAGIDPGRFFGHRPVFDRLAVDSYVVLPRRLAQSDFNLAHQGCAISRPYDSQSDFFQNLALLLRTDRNRKFVYCYWPDLDRISHEMGAFSAEADWHFSSWEKGFRRFLAAVSNTSSLILLTADHGFIDTTATRTLELEHHPALQACLRLPLCGESRVAYCYVKARQTQQFETYVRSELAEAVDLWPSEELLAQGWFGTGEPHPGLLDRIGDYTLVMKENWIIRDWLPQERRFTHIGVHGGISPQEMRIPLLTAAA